VVSSLYGFFYAINWLLLAQKKTSCINIVKVDANNHKSLLNVSRNLPGVAEKSSPLEFFRVFLGLAWNVKAEFYTLM